MPFIYITTKVFEDSLSYSCDTTDSVHYHLRANKIDLSLEEDTALACHYYLCVGPPQGTGTLTVSSFNFYLAIQSKGVVKEVILRGSATPGRKHPKGPCSGIVMKTEKN